MNTEKESQWTDSIALFDYGFANFQKLNVAENDTKYTVNSGSSFYTGNDVLGNSKPILSLNTSDYLVLPNTVAFTDVQSTISYDTVSDNQAAVISYTYQNWPVGTASIDFTGTLESGYEFESYVDSSSETGEENTSEDSGNKTDKPVNESDKTAGTSLLLKIGKGILFFILGLLGLAIIGLIALFIYRYIQIRKRRKRRRNRAYTLSSGSDPYAMVNKDYYRKSQITDAKRRQRAAEAKRRNRRRTARWR